MLSHDDVFHCIVHLGYIIMYVLNWMDWIESIYIIVVIVMLAIIAIAIAIEHKNFMMWNNIKKQALVLAIQTIGWFSSVQFSCFTMSLNQSNWNTILLLMNVMLFGDVMLFGCEIVCHNIKLSLFILTSFYFLFFMLMLCSSGCLLHVYFTAFCVLICSALLCSFICPFVDFIHLVHSFYPFDSFHLVLVNVIHFIFIWFTSH